MKNFFFFFVLSLETCFFFFFSFEHQLDPLVPLWLQGWDFLQHMPEYIGHLLAYDTSLDERATSVGSQRQLL